MTVKTISRANTESIEITISTEELSKLAVEKLLKARPDLSGKLIVRAHIISNTPLFSDEGVIKVDINL